MLRVTFLLTAASALGAVAHSQEANYDESKVPQYELPDPLLTIDGRTVDSAKMWTQVRRPEVLRLFEQHIFGRLPQIDVTLRTRVHECTPVLEDRGVREQYTIYFTDDDSGPSVDVLVFRPSSDETLVPAVLGLNFAGNHTIDPDPAIRMPTSWVRIDRRIGNTTNQAEEVSRGRRVERWDVEQIVSRGYALVTAYYGDIDPDFHDEFQNGIHQLDTERGADRATDAGGSISAWAWGLSRILDTLEQHPHIDGQRVAVFGHSRLGKTSLWAGATDQRFAMVISNNSGCGGAALARRRFGETVARINRVFPHWFCLQHRSYNNDEDALPVDQHELAALIAPRPLYVASAEKDRWADPHGEMLSVYHAGPVYTLFGRAGLPSSNPAVVGEPQHHDVGYHIRSGKHDVTSYDWEQYLNFADRHIR